MNLIKELIAEVQQSIHSLRAGMIGHRCLKFSYKTPGHLFHTLDSVECECGKTFYRKYK